MDWEASFLLYIQEHIRTDFMNPFMTALTHTGDYGIFLIALAVLLLIIPKTRRIGLIAGISIAIEALLTNVFIKNAVARTRPYEAIDGLVNLIEKQKDYSFPSGHSGAAFAVMGAILVIAILGLPVAERSGKITRSKMSTAYKIVAVIAIIYATTLAFSRLYVGVHYPTDVLGGILLGIATSFASYFIYRAILKVYAQKKANAN
jgi:undecaprenyl-diphosphatase